MVTIKHQVDVPDTALDRGPSVLKRHSASRATDLLSEVHTGTFPVLRACGFFGFSCDDPCLWLAPCFF